jgi:hypothetical protein
MNTTVIEGSKNMATNRQTTIKESKMKITASNVIRWSGLAAVAAGIIYTVIQPIHPPDVLASVSTDAWAIITPVKTAMAMLFLFGITGIYARQVRETGWLGLVGFLLLILSWMLNLSYIFAETFIIPLLTTTSPTLIDGFFGIVNGHPVDINLGALPGIFGFVGITYMLGGLLFGIATFRAGILPRWAAGLLAVASALTPLAALVPHEFQRLAGMPVGLALAWLGYARWSQRQAIAAESMRDMGNPQLAK